MNQEQINLYNYASKQMDQLVLKEAIPYLLISFIATIIMAISLGFIIKNLLYKQKNVETLTGMIRPAEERNNKDKWF
jgi:hypothetical protein